MFLAQLERKKEVNSAFFISLSIFCDAVSVDATYATNQYNMKFVPFTGFNHHLQSVFLGAAFISNEKIESFVWCFKSFLEAMGGAALHLIVIDECASMKAAISEIMPETIHRLCM
jgi:hypothetical protein